MVANVAFLGLDIAVAHAENGFERRAEWTPLVFSGVATLLLLPTAFGVTTPIWRRVDRLVAVASIALGVLGMVFHLQSAFFQERTIANLVYSAPFVAPLAYVGLGLLLLLLRTERAGSPAIGWWTLLLAFGGFVGNLGMSLLDHAQNGFFHGTEWIPVVAGALGASFLFVTWLAPDPVIARVTYAVLAGEALVGALGFCLHTLADWRRPAARITDRFVFGAPAFAPLLFVDLALLGALGLWATGRTRAPTGPVTRF